MEYVVLELDFLCVLMLGNPCLNKELGRHTGKSVSHVLLDCSTYRRVGRLYK